MALSEPSKDELASLRGEQERGAEAFAPLDLDDLAREGFEVFPLLEWASARTDEPVQVGPLPGRLVAQDGARPAVAERRRRPLPRLAPVPEEFRPQSHGRSPGSLSVTSPLRRSLVLHRRQRGDVALADEGPPGERVLE